MKTNTLLAFIGGALVGAAAALLLAPESGEQTRKRIKEMIRDEVGEIEEEVAEKVNKKASNGKRQS